MREMDKERFMIKWFETHTEMNVLDHANNTSLINTKMSHRRKQDLANTKRNIECNSIKKQKEDMSELLYDAVSVRKREILDKEALPMKDLLGLTIKNLPQHSKIESTVEGNFTFADMIERSSFSLTRVDGVEIEEADESGE